MQTNKTFEIPDWFKDYVKYFAILDIVADAEERSKRLQIERVGIIYQITKAQNHSTFLSYYNECLHENLDIGYTQYELNEQQVTEFTEKEWQYIRNNADLLIRSLYVNKLKYIKWSYRKKKGKEHEQVTVNSTGSNTLWTRKCNIARRSS